MTTPGGLYIMRVWWTSYPEATPAPQTLPWSPQRAAPAVAAARASAASRPAPSRRSCANSRRPCCACSAVRVRSTRPSAPVATPCAARAAPPSSSCVPSADHGWTTSSTSTCQRTPVFSTWLWSDLLCTYRTCHVSMNCTSISYKRDRLWREKILQHPSAMQRIGEEKPTRKNRKNITTSHRQNVPCVESAPAGWWPGGALGPRDIPWTFLLFMIK